MPNPRFQVAIGVVDGVNRQFETSEDYGTDTLAVFRNGALMEKSADNGWAELGVKLFELKIAPKAQDVVHVFYMDTLPSEGIAVEIEVEKIHGTVEPVGEVLGFVLPVGQIFGVVEPIDNVLGVVVERGEVLGVIEEQSTIVGFVRECG